jgi:hypothetical protein
LTEHRFPPYRIVVRNLEQQTRWRGTAQPPVSQVRHWPGAADATTFYLTVMLIFSETTGGLKG